MAIDIKTTRSTLEALAKQPNQSIRTLAGKKGIGKDKAYKLKEKLDELQLTAEQIAQMPDSELSVLFMSSQDRKSWHYPDFLAVFNHIYKNKDHKPGSDAALVAAWRELYLQGVFKIDRDINPAYPGPLPEGCMPFATFRRKYRQWEELNNVEPVLAASSETGPIPSEITETTPGSQMQIDASGDPFFWKMLKAKGLIKSHLFVAVLPYSGLAFAWLGPDLSARSWCLFLIAAVTFFQGCPYTCKSDNDGGIIKRRKIKAVNGEDKYSNTLNTTVRYVSGLLGLEWILCDPLKPTAKGMVERIVGAFQRFHGVVLGHGRDDAPVAVSYEHINEMLLQDVAEFNSRPVKDRKFSRQAFFDLFERQHLAPCPNLDFCIPDKVEDNHSVSVSGYTRIRGNNYFVGEKYAACAVKVLFFPDNKIEILMGDTGVKLKEYTLHTAATPRVLNIKHEEDYTSDELYVSRSLDELMQYSSRHMPDIAVELNQVLSEFFAHSRLPDVDKTRSGNRLLELCKEFYNCAATQLKQGLDCILHSGKFDNLTIISVLEDFISVSTTTAPRLSAAKTRQLMKGKTKAKSNPKSNKGDTDK